MIQISIIIVNYNTLDCTVECIESIIKHTYGIAYEIIVVDNASDTMDPNVFVEKFPSIRLIVNNSNLGFGYANNLGAQYASGGYFLLLNSDTIIIDNAICKAHQCLQSQEIYGVGVLGCQLLNQDRTFQNSYYDQNHTSFKVLLKNSLLQNPIIKLFFSTSNKTISTVKPNRSFKFVSGVFGAFMLLKRDSFLAVKGFDPDFFMYAEEIEMQARISRNYKIAIDFDLNVIHLVSKSSEKLSQNRYNQIVLSNFLMYYKFGVLFYVLSVFLHYLNVFMYRFLHLFISSISAPKYHDIKLKLIKYVLWHIPKYKNSWGSRDSPLRYFN